jgi:hypothetical protein
LQGIGVYIFNRQDFLKLTGIIKKILTATAKKAKKEGKKHRFLHPYSPPNLGSMRLCGKKSSIELFRNLSF